MKIWKMPLSEFSEYVTCEFVGGELIASVEGRKISMGRKRNGVFEYSLAPVAQKLLERVITEKQRLPARKPIPPKKAANVDDAPVVPVESVKRKKPGRPKKVGLHAETQNSEL